MLMKFVLLSLTIALAVAIERHPESDPCAPSTEFYVDCNRCRCANDGRGAACTRKFCIPGEYNEAGVLIAPANKSLENDEFIVVEEEPEQCEVGKKYKVNCNTCRCSSSGKLVCTKIGCIHKQQKRTIVYNYPDLPEKNCEFGKTYRKDCNTCICGKEGTAVCTLKSCEADIEYYSRNSRNVEKWGPIYKQGDSCEPNRMFYSECNQCLCSSDGKSAACTLKMCLPHH